jgi:transposase
MAALQPEERREAPVPAHPNPHKEKDIKNHGEQAARTALWRFSGIDLTRIDGIRIAAGQTILTEVGTNLSAFPSEHHFVSWLRLCPRRPISGGKPLKKTRNAMGANRVANTLRMAANSLGRGKTALGAEYRRIARHKGASVAVILPRFRGHPNRRENARGVSHDKEEAKEVHARVQGGGREAVQGR